MSAKAKSASGVYSPVPIALINDSLRVQIRRNIAWRSSRDGNDCRNSISGWAKYRSAISGLVRRSSRSTSTPTTSVSSSSCSATPHSTIPSVWATLKGCRAAWGPTTDGLPCCSCWNSMESSSTWGPPRSRRAMPRPTTCWFRVVCRRNRFASSLSCSVIHDSHFASNWPGSWEDAGACQTWIRTAAFRPWVSSLERWLEARKSEESDTARTRSWKRPANGNLKCPVAVWSSLSGPHRTRVRFQLLPCGDELLAGGDGGTQRYSALLIGKSDIRSVQTCGLIRCSTGLQDRIAPPFRIIHRAKGGQIAQSRWLATCVAARAG